VMVGLAIVGLVVPTHRHQMGPRQQDAGGPHSLSFHLVPPSLPHHAQKSKRPSSSEDGRFVLHKGTRGATSLSPAHQKNPPVMADRNQACQPHSLQVRSLRPAQDNALDRLETIPSALITVATPAPTTNPTQVFGGQLPGPFAACAGIGLPPFPDSLNLALTATIPDLSLWSIPLLAEV
jgi:hypothetical protein